MKMPSGPASTPTSPPAASGWFTSTLGEPLIMYRFGAIFFAVNSILLKSVPCAHKLTHRATAAKVPRDNCHADFMTCSFLVLGKGIFYPITSAEDHSVYTAAARPSSDIAIQQHFK